MRSRAARLMIAGLMAVALLTGREASAQAWYNMDFNVRDAVTGAPIGGALVQIDIDFGNGTQRWTDGGGNANFGVVGGYQISYSVEASGYHTTWGGPIGLATDGFFQIWLQPIAPPPPPPVWIGVGQPVEYATHNGRVILTPFEDDGDANTIEMRVHYIAPTGRFQVASCVRLWSNNPDWVQEIGCSFGLAAGIWEDDYDYTWPRYTGTLASAYIDYQAGRPVQPPNPGDGDPFGRYWNGVPCIQLQWVEYRWRLIHDRAVRNATRDAALGAVGCVGASIGWGACVGVTWGISFLVEAAFEYWDYKQACAY